MPLKLTAPCCARRWAGAGRGSRVTSELLCKLATTWMLVTGAGRGRVSWKPSLRLSRALSVFPSSLNLESTLREKKEMFATALLEFPWPITSRKKFTKVT